MELFFISSLLIPLLSTLLFFFYFHHQKHQASKQPSILKPYPLFGTLPHLIKNHHRFLEWVTETLTQSPTLHTITITGPISTNGIITADPRNVEHMLKTNFPNFPKGQRNLTILQDFIGHGIFNSDGPHWNRQRKTASYEFNKRTLRQFVMDTVHHEIVDRLLPLLAKATVDHQTVELQDVFERFGFDNVCKLAFGHDPACLTEQGKGSEIMKAFGDAQDLTVARFMGALEFTWRIKKLMNVGTEKKLKRSIAIIHEFAEKIIKSKRDNGTLQDEDDLLSRFAANEDSTDELLRDNVISFIVAGRETTSSALTWFFWLLSSRPDEEKRILEEVKSVREANQEYKEIYTFSFDELREMNYLHAAITESMRLYPPVPLDTQSCRDGDVMPDGTFVGKNWFVTYSTYAMGRMEDIWGKDCVEYKPERWLDENGAFRPESAYKFPVFHAGPRMCLGKEMAYIQMKSIVATVLPRFEVQVMMEEGKIPEPLLSLTMRMKGGLPIRVRERV